MINVTCLLTLENQFFSLYPQNNMLDFVFAVDDSVTWHMMNLLKNKSHYSFLKVFGPKQISNIQSYGAGIYYNTLVPCNGRVSMTSGKLNICVWSIEMISLKQIFMEEAHLRDCSLTGDIFNIEISNYFTNTRFVNLSLHSVSLAICQWLWSVSLLYVWGNTDLNLAADYIVVVNWIFTVWHKKNIFNVGSCNSHTYCLITSWFLRFGYS